MITPKGFKKQNTEVRPRLIISVEGKAKDGKTHFALTAPAPICFFNLDKGIEGVIHKFSNKEIYVSDYPVAIDPSDKYPDMTKVAPIWEKFKEDYITALNAGAPTHLSQGIRTIIIDTATEANELIKLARLGKLSQVVPFNYVPVNYEFKSLLDQALICPRNVNIIFLHQQHTKWVDGHATREVERAGFKSMEFIVQAYLRSFYDDGCFNLEILDCRHNKSLKGFTMAGNDTCNFQTVASMLLPQFPAEVWQ